MVMELMDSSLQDYMDPSNNDKGISGLFKKEFEGSVLELTLDMVKFMHIITDICSGMAYIETKKCVHRDLRTDNILIKKIPVREIMVYLLYVPYHMISGISTVEKVPFNFVTQ